MLKDYVLQGKASGKNPIDAFQRFADENGVPLTVGFELTHHCNFHCKMCYMHTNEERARSLGRELTAEEWIELAREAKQHGTLFLLFTGGEVFTRPDFQYIYETIYDMGFWISILTNASLITEKEIEWLKKRKPYGISISLYGCSAEVYDRTCANASGYERTMHALDLLYQEGFNVSLKSVSLAENWQDRETIKRLANARGWRYNNIAVLESSRLDTGEHFYRDSIDHDGNLYPLDVKWEPDKADEFHRKWWQELVKAQPEIEKHFKAHKGFSCTAGRSRCWITWYGKMQACAELTIPITEPLKVGFGQAWHDLQEKVFQLHNPQECLECTWFPICRQCPGTHLSDTGAYNKVSKRICNECILAFLRSTSIDNKQQEKEVDCIVEEV